jgi:hypothetical protein
MPTRGWVFVAVGMFVTTTIGTLFVVGSQSDSVDPVEQEPVDFSVGFSASAVLAEIPRSQIGTAADITISALDIAAVAQLTGVERIGFCCSGVEWDSILVYALLIETPHRSWPCPGRSTT